MQAKYGIEWLDVSRIFPTKGAGTKRGWHYEYPVVEVIAPPSRAVSCHDEVS